MKNVLISLIYVYSITSRCCCLYSSFDVHDSLVKETGNYFITINNLCIAGNTKNNINTIILHVKNGDNIYLYDKLMEYQYNFASDIVIKINETNMFQSLYIDDDVWVSSASFNFNICHFTDNLIFYLIKNDRRYPAINNLLFLELDPRHNLFYNNMILKLILKNINYKTLYFKQDISKLQRKMKYKHICFKTVHLIIRSKHRGFAGVFKSFITRNKFRDEGYTYLRIKHIVEDVKNGDKDITITIIKRKVNNSRNITNIELIKRMIKSMRYDYKEIYFDGKLPTEQIQIIMNAKIVLSPFGSNLINMIWILSPKVLIIECMATYVLMDYNVLTYSVGYKYIPLFSLFHFLDQFSFDKNYPEDRKFNSVPCVVLNTFKRYKYPVHYTNGDNMTISTKQVKFSIYYGLVDLKNKVSFQK